MRTIASSPRLLAVTAQSFSSGLPLGLVTVAIPTWAAALGYSTQDVGLLTAAQLPWAVKFLWSPLIDRLSPPPLRGKRGWILLMQASLAALVFALALHAASGPHIALIAALSFLIALTSATQDIAIDAYAVESLHKDEQGMAVGVRSAVYRAAMWLSGSLAITLSATLGWGLTCAAVGACFLILSCSAIFAPEPPPVTRPPETSAEAADFGSSLRRAVITPVLEFVQKPRAFEIIAFLLLYKLADNLAIALVRPFLIQMGYSTLDVGVVTGTVGLFATLTGTFLGGMLAGRFGLGRALWICGILQAFGDAGYAAVAAVGPDRLFLYGATLLDTTTTGLGTGAFMVLLLRLTSKRFSATQYALFSSVFALSRTLCGPIAGHLAAALGWQNFFLASILFSLPGLWLLSRFIPWNCRELPNELEGDSV